jgi:hypothetical protein
VQCAILFTILLSVGLAIFVFAPFSSGSEVSRLVGWTYAFSMLLSIAAMLLIYYRHSVGWEFDVFLYFAFLVSIFAIAFSFLKIGTLRGTQDLISIKSRV